MNGIVSAGSSDTCAQRQASQLGFVAVVRGDVDDVARLAAATAAERLRALGR